ncbi:MAG TPA: hypothetical protein PLV61_09270 [Parvularculaceae bacterium]|nr:hypothetical protein [Parvularculaceae bacterium]
MNRLRSFILLTIAAASVSDPVAAQTASIALEPADQQKLGVETTTLATTTIEASVPAFVRVLDPSALAMLDGDLTAADAAASASGKERDRLARLAAADASASRQAAEAAAAKASADAAQALTLKRRLSVEWSPALAAMTADERAALVNDLIAGKAALIRADVLGASAVGANEVSIFANDGAPVMGAVIGRAGAADPRMRTLGVMAIAKGAGVEFLPPGAAFEGRISGGGEMSGVVIPRSAIIRLDGANWAYVQTGDAEFERREISGAVKTQEGWFVAQGFSAGEKLAVKGAGSLLGVERADESAESD